MATEEMNNQNSPSRTHTDTENHSTCPSIASSSLDHRVLIITFATTTDAMSMDRLCAQRNLPGRLIPIPRAISAGCGLSWKAPLSAEPELREAMEQASISWQNIHTIDLSS